MCSTQSFTSKRQNMNIFKTKDDMHEMIVKFACADQP